MDPITAAAFTSYQYQQALLAGGPGAAVASALGTAQSLATLESSLLPAPEGPAALLELSPQALQASATYALAAQAGQGEADVQALLGQATAASSGATVGLLPSAGGFPLTGAATEAALAGYQFLQAQQAGQANAELQALIDGSSAATINLLA